MPTASSRVPVKRTAPSRTRARQAEPDSDLEVLSRADDGLTIEGRLFGQETFVFSTDVNAHVISLAAKTMGGLSDFFHRQVSIDHLIDGKSQRQIDGVAFDEKRRFDDLLSQQQGLTFERYGKLFADLIEEFGNDEAGNAETST